jgi:hypothetical protein
MLGVTIKFRPVYTCSQCGSIAEGDLRTIQSIVYSLDAIKPRLKETPSGWLPIGWASYYSPKGHDFRCPGCQ